MCGNISHYNTIEDKGKKLSVRISSNYIARMPEDRYPTFKHEFEKELNIAVQSPSTVKLVITDAHKSISGYLKENPAFHGYLWIIDFYRASDHLSQLAEAIHGKSSGEAKTRYKKYRNILKNDEHGVSKLIRSVEYYL